MDKSMVAPTQPTALPEWASQPLTWIPSVAEISLPPKLAQFSSKQA